MDVSSGPVFLSKKRRIGSSSLRVNLPQKKKKTGDHLIISVTDLTASEQDRHIFN